MYVYVYVSVYENVYMYIYISLYVHIYVYTYVFNTNICTYLFWQRMEQKLIADDKFRTMQAKWSPELYNYTGYTEGD